MSIDGARWRACRGSSLVAAGVAIVMTAACPQATTTPTANKGGSGGAAGSGGSGGTAGGGGSGGAAGRGATDGPPQFDAAADPVADRTPDRAPDTPADVSTDRSSREASRDVDIKAAQMACTRLAINRCNQFKVCEGQIIVDRVYGSQVGCHAFLEATCMDGLLLPWSGDTPMRVNACADAVANPTPASCAAHLIGADIAICTAPGGGIENGGICLGGEQCASGVCQSYSTAEPCGTCRARIALGGNCFGAARACVTGTVCAWEVCVTPARIDEACSSAKPCGLGLACLAKSDLVADTTCRKFAMEGETCGADGVAPPCDNRFSVYCNYGPGGATFPRGKCTLLKLADAGGTCGTLADGTQIACKSAVCRRDLSGGQSSPTGTCIARVKLGEACNTQSQTGPLCGPGLICVLTTAGGTTGTCGARDFAMCPK